MQLVDIAMAEACGSTACSARGSIDLVGWSGGYLIVSIALTYAGEGGRVSSNLLLP